MLIGLDIIYWYRATFLQFYIYQLLEVVLSEIRSDGGKDHENKKVWEERSSINVMNYICGFAAVMKKERAKKKKLH